MALVEWNVERFAQVDRVRRPEPIREAERLGLQQPKTENGSTIGPKMTAEKLPRSLARAVASGWWRLTVMPYRSEMDAMVSVRRICARSSLVLAPIKGYQVATHEK